MQVNLPIGQASSRRGSPPRFSGSQRVALERAIATHDEVDIAVTLPAATSISFQGDLLDRCYWLSHQLWRDVDGAVLVRLAGSLARTGKLSQRDAKTFKDIRARAKQLRFSYATLGAGHIYPKQLDRLTRFMGQAQDAMKDDRRVKAAARGMLLRLMLTALPIARLDREIDGFLATTPEEFQNNIRREIGHLRQSLKSPAVTNKAFHEMRKIVSRLVAFYDTLTVLAPSEDHRAIDRYLSTINGLMGSMHDDMAKRKATDRRHYMHVDEPLPAAIADRLEALVAAFDRADHASRSRLPSST